MTISNRQTKSRPKVIVKVSCNLKIVKGQKALAQASTKVSSKARKRKKKEKKKKKKYLGLETKCVSSPFCRLSTEV